MTKGLGPKGGTNAYYSDKSLVPQTGGLVRPDSAPGLQQGIGLNLYTPPAGGAGRNQLASAMAGPALPMKRRLSDWERGSPFFGQPVPGAYGVRYQGGSGSHGGGRG
jgi:hypothetical protein